VGAEGPYRESSIIEIIVLLVVLLLGVAGAPAGADTAEFAEFPLPDGATPGGVAVGFDAVWYTDGHPNDKIGKLDMKTGELLAQYSSPTPGIHAAITTGFESV
jgi:streptogramin lyase